MRSLGRFVGRAPARILASVLSIALAVGALGVLAIPGVAGDSLGRLARQDQLAHVAADTTALASVDDLEVPGAAAVEGRVVRTVQVGDDQVTLVGFDPAAQQVNVVHAEVGRLPGPGELLVGEGVADIGDVVPVGDQVLTVVGIGGTTWWRDGPAVYADLPTAQALTGADGVDRVLVRLADPSADALDAAVDDLRHELAAHGATYRTLPTTLPDGRHPIEDDLVQVSTMIGLLGIVAGLVALVLLASTTNALITERTREVATMRALGGSPRRLRRRLRGLALGIAAAGLAVGVPMGVAVANWLARMVLERFTGITPALAVSWPVVAASAAFALGGAWLVSARAARRVTRLPLAEALRDREGAPFGRRRSERVLARIPTGGLVERLALRSGVHRRGRTVAVLTQLTAGVAAVIVVASLWTSVQAFDVAELEPWRWRSSATAVDPGLPFDADLAAADPDVEPVVDTWGRTGDWEVEVFGFDPGTALLDHAVRDGRWLDGARGAVVSAGFADRQGIGVGDAMTVELASGPHEYEVVGLHRSRSRDVYLPRQVLAADLGSRGSVNAFWSVDDAATLERSLDLPAVVEVTTLDDVAAEGRSARAIITDIFLAIGAVVVGVTLLGVTSAMAVSLYERRHELAALQAIGAGRGQVRRLLATELVPLGIVASVLGTALGWWGAQWIVASFEASDAVEIGAVFAAGMVPVAVAGCLAAVALVALTGARRAVRRPVGLTLRGSA